MRPESAHAVCLHCWGAYWATKGATSAPTPFRVPNPAPARCCWCRHWTSDGVYLRHPDAELTCKHTAKRVEACHG